MSLLKVLVASVAVWQAGMMISQGVERTERYREARQHADRLGKPLLVVGGPLGSDFHRMFSIPAHGFGDVCLDINPGACRNSVPYVDADIRDIPFEDQVFGAVYVSHVLEHLATTADCAQAVRELTRVADRVFVCCPRKGTILAWLAPEHHLWVRQEGDILIVEQR